MIFYTIIKITDLSKIKVLDFSNDDEISIKKNTLNTLCILKFKGMPPKSLNGIEIVEFGGRLYHNHSQMMAMKKIVSNDLSLGWVKIEENE